MPKAVTTVSVDSELLARARAAGLTISRLLEEAIRAELGMVESAAPEEELREVEDEIRGIEERLAGIASEMARLRSERGELEARLEALRRRRLSLRMQASGKSELVRQFLAEWNERKPEHVRDKHELIMKYVGMGVSQGRLLRALRGS